MSKYEEVRRTIHVPVLTTEQAQALENLRTCPASDSEIIDMSSGQLPRALHTLSRYDLRIAIDYGYDIIVTPEQHIAEKYKAAERINAVNKAHAYRLGIVAAWNALREGEVFPFNLIDEDDDQ